MPDIENLLNIEDEVTQVLSDLGVNEKLSEMDDFMNQNDLKVNITNENAVVTGLVTYTCTVKDKNNTALANKVVEWYKGTTLLGMDATDSNGISTFSHRVTEADIYDVHAVVRGTHAGDDIRMFVKDKTNLVNHNAWSGTDYLKSTSGFAHSPSIELLSSTDWASNCERSLKVTSTVEGYAVVSLDTFTELVIGTQITGEVTILNNTGYTVQLRLAETEAYNSVDIPSNTAPQEITISRTKSEESSDLILQCITRNPLILYIDDVSLIIVQ